MNMSSKFKRRRKAKVRPIHKHLQISWGHCLLLLVGYLAMSVLIFSVVFRRQPGDTTTTNNNNEELQHNWTLIDCCYFAIVTVSTVGYGDFHPTTVVERLVTCLYVLTGASLVAISLGLLGSNFGELQHSANFSGKSKKEEDDKKEADTAPGVHVKGWGPRIRESLRKVWIAKRNIVENTIVAFLICLLGYLIGRDQEWDVPSTIYFGIMTGKKEQVSALLFVVHSRCHYCLIHRCLLLWGKKTATTVGFGDLTPDSQYARALAILFTPCAAFTMGRCIQYVATSIINRRRFQTMELFFGTCTVATSNSSSSSNSTNQPQPVRHQLTLQDLKAMDRNGDGHVSWSDFLEFMLLAMNQVDAGMIQELRKQFDRLDKTGAFDKRHQEDEEMTLPWGQSLDTMNNLTRRQHQQLTHI